MHVHHFLTKDGVNVFHDDNGLYQLSDLALQYIAGILDHAPSLLALTNPTTNSYRRLVPGYEAPVKAVFAEGNRSAAIRIPGYVKDPAERRFEFRTIDATCNPYMAFAGDHAGWTGRDPDESSIPRRRASAHTRPTSTTSRLRSLPGSGPSLSPWERPSTPWRRTGSI